MTGAVEKPAGGTTQDYVLTYTVTDSDGNKTTVERTVTVTNEVPVIENIPTITIRQGQSADLVTGVTSTDLEDGNLTGSIVMPTIDVTTLTVGTHTVEYTVTDSDGNETTVERTIIVESNVELPKPGLGDGGDVTPEIMPEVELPKPGLGDGGDVTPEIMPEVPQTGIVSYLIILGALLVATGSLLLTNENRKAKNEEKC